MSAHFIQHWIKNVRARCHDYKNAPLTLELRVEGNDLPGEVTLYLENDDLTAALVRAINDCVDRYRKPAAEPSPDPEESEVPF